MSDKNSKFWLALLGITADTEEKIRLWNGYLTWKLPQDIKENIEPQDSWNELIVVPPNGGWPELYDSEKRHIDMLARENGGHPKFSENYMNFKSAKLTSGIKFSGLTFICSTFDSAKFSARTSFEKARFFGQTLFNRALFWDIDFSGARFNAPVYFESSRFQSIATFIGVDFMSGASFKNASFEGQVRFNDSKFEERYFPSNFTPMELADFKNAKFLDRASFRKVLFGNIDKTYSRKIWPERRVDFTDAQFKTTTDFYGAVFGGAPAFFNTILHEDTDFSGINWSKAETENISADFAIRAWERLELIMSKLEKPLERHQFFRLKMRARRRTDNWFLRVLNRLFETTADYGWGVRRAFLFWFGHWLVSSLILYLNAGAEAITEESWKLAKAALGTGFANAHAFFGLATGEGYLAGCRQVLEENNALGFLRSIGVIETFLGPIFLFLLLLTLRNRFRLV